MTNGITDEIVTEIRALYGSDPSAQALFDWTAQRSRDATATSIDRICNQLDISRGEAVALAKRLQEAGCGEFIVGRRGQKSRFNWNYSCISLGQAAAGESASIEAVDDPVSEDEDEYEADERSAEVSPQIPLTLTIAEAKAILAASLGVPVNSVEITVKA